jgi:transposase
MTKKSGYAEKRQLRKDKADLEDTVEILKKAAAIFSQSQRKIRNSPR